jgi:DNA-binding PadR family transcriptional regulator
MKMSANYFKILGAAMDEKNPGLTGAELSGLTGIGRGSIYVHLGRMAEKGWVTHDVQLEEGGGSRTFYSVTGLGQSALAYEVKRRDYQAAMDGLVVAGRWAGAGR